MLNRKRRRSRSLRENRSIGKKQNRALFHNFFHLQSKIIKVCILLTTVRSYRGIDLDQLLDLNQKELMKLYPARARRRFSRGLTRKYTTLLKKLRAAKKAADQYEKPECIKTHLRDMIIVPEMIGSVVGVYQGKTFNQVEIKVIIFLILWFSYSLFFGGVDDPIRLRCADIIWESFPSPTNL